MVTLTNRSRTSAIIISLPTSFGTVPHTHRSVDRNLDGEVGVRVTERELCDSVHIMPGETSRPLPDEAAELPEVRAQGRYLTVSHVTE